MKKIIIFLITLAFATSISNAQEVTPLFKVHEVGIGFSSTSNFSLQYRWGNEHRLFRISGNIGGTTSNGNSSNNSSTVQDTINSGSTGNTKTTTPINLNCGLSFSILKIKSISEKFGFVYGGIYGFSYSINQATTTTTTDYTGPYTNSNYTSTSTTKKNSQTFQPSAGIVLGAAYKINSSFSIIAEIDPNIYYAYNKTTQNTTTTSNKINNNYTTINSNPSSTNTFGLANFANSGALITIAYRISK